MLQVVGNEVTYLTRIRFGSLRLEKTLANGEYRPLTDAEIAALQNDATKEIPKEIRKDITKDITKDDNDNVEE